MYNPLSSLTKFFLVLRHKLAVSLQPAYLLSPLIFPPSQHSAHLGPAIILALRVSVGLLGTGAGPESRNNKEQGPTGASVWWGRSGLAWLRSSPPACSGNHPSAPVPPRWPQPIRACMKPGHHCQAVAPMVLLTKPFGRWEGVNFRVPTGLGRKKLYALCRSPIPPASLSTSHPCISC
jgi:hypothetical protein